MSERAATMTPRILVLGIGGGGSNAISRMADAGIRGVELVAMNTDQQALSRAQAHRRVRLGEHVTSGRGTGGDPGLGAAAAHDSAEELRRVCGGADMVFVTAGMGGGTGTGAAPVIAQMAREAGALTVGVVTKPFSFEGSRRMRIAEDGIESLREHVHTLITIPNERVLQVIDRRTSMAMAFGVIDDVLRQCVQGISDLVTVPGLINLDFADVRTVMSESGAALMSVGSASGEGRASEAAEAAMSSPLLDLSIEGASGVLFNITAGLDLALHEVQRAAEIIREAADPEANIIFGAVIDDGLENELRITVIATGFDPAKQRARPARPGKEERPFWRRWENDGPAPASGSGSRTMHPDDWLDLPPTLRRRWSDPLTGHDALMPGGAGLLRPDRGP